MRREPKSMITRLFTSTRAREVAELDLPPISGFIFFFCGCACGSGVGLIAKSI